MRRRLLGAAVEPIAERGWTAVSTRAVAEHAEVVPGLAHYHFTSAQALSSTAAVGAMRDAASMLKPTLTRARTPQEALALPASVLLTETYPATTRDPSYATRSRSRSGSPPGAVPDGGRLAGPSSSRTAGLIACTNALNTPASRA